MRKRVVKQKKSQNTSSSGQVRIIGGQWRGRKLPVHDIEGLRPTTDRVKETVFNWLMHDVVDATCMDCFAGSGGLGFEALSRYAESVTFLEYSSTVARQLETNLKTLNASHGKVICCDTLEHLANPDQAYDLVFVDPPFRKDMLEATCNQLESNGWLSESAKIYVEYESESQPINFPSNWRCLKEKTAGQVVFALYEKE
ncbi:16S rRNA (guanine(966)-N(2))-methyltransferase RsmD [Algicola sagamiensis]|uniref:16S rRNA (guanine(966)-N(2))-methyltransferase RsmD n=1 Tax=Algicola sagamiensis TaxID=163869 RepID=UPI00036C07B9|nr:16S rRNA (guanine(966)-N(2))-methyltransferase RsmD [Algicola sagamiensis]